MCKNYETNVAGKKHSKIQFDPEENQWKIQVMNNPNISANSFASISTKAIGKTSISTKVNSRNKSAQTGIKLISKKAIGRKSIKT